jgi:hypothetical protein
MTKRNDKPTNPSADDVMDVVRRGYMLCGDEDTPGAFLAIVEVLIDRLGKHSDDENQKFADHFIKWREGLTSREKREPKR